MIEFLLPLELLSLPVDQWQVEEGELARPLCVEHHVIVRYRDRPQVRGGYGQWRGKTRRLRNGGATVQWVDPNNTAAVGRLSGHCSRRRSVPRAGAAAAEAGSYARRRRGLYRD